MKKILAIGIILLFISVAVAPSINFTVVKASSDNDLVEVTTQACGIKGFGNTTVKLTREQYQNLEQYLVDFRARLNKTTSREEAVPIFKEAVVELNKYGLLPKGMSVERAQRLVTSQYQNNNMEKLQKRLLQSHLSRLGNNSNLLCLVTGQVNTSYSIFPLINIISYVMSLSYNFFLGITGLLGFLYIIFSLPDGWIYLAGISLALAWVSYVIMSICFVSSNSASLAIGNVVGIGGYWKDEHGSGYYESTGWLKSFGLLGKKEWNTVLYGRLPTLWIALTDDFTKFSLPGLIGFTGFKISSGDDNKFYLGSTLAMKVSSEPPE
jgi:hypothetical protein